MSDILLAPAKATREDVLIAPLWAEIVEITPEAEGVSTFWLAFKDKALAASYRFAPGQFNMVYLPGYGEAAISISSHPAKPERIGHTIRFVGNVTNAISRLRPGDTLGLRGPFGMPWPIADIKGRDVIIAAGGIGLAPLRPAIYHIIENRADYGKVTIIYGARAPGDLLYPREYDAWRKKGLEVLVTVDRGDENWAGQVGVVPILFYNLRVRPENSVILTCGPEIMMRFVVFESLARRVSQEHIFVSLERNMKCGQGFCGHCQIGPYFICKEGPVFHFGQLAPFFNVENF
ncbi:MAG: FAD/NAD(P)-binding protein [Anaerolineales bacterium]